MADDPLMGYKSPDDDPLMGYQSAPPANTDLGHTAFWNKPADVGWGDYLKAHAMGAVSPLTSTDISPDKTAAEGLLLLHGATAGLSGFDPGLRKATAQAEQDNPNSATGLEMGGYILGPGKLGLGARAARMAGGGRLASMGGSALEGGTVSGLDVLGRGGDIASAGMAALKGALISGPLGFMFPAGRGGPPAAPSTADLKATSQQVNNSLTTIPVNSTQMAKSFNNVTATIPSGDRMGISKSLGDKIDDISKEIYGAQSADDIAKYQRALMKSARGASDQEIAGRYIDGLNTALGPTAQDIAAASRASNLYKTSRDIEGWATDPAKAPAAIQGALAKKPSFYQGQPGLYDALSQIGRMGGPLSLVRQAINKAAGPTIGAGVGALGGHPIVGGFLGREVLPEVMSNAGNSAIKNRLLAARHLAATGQQVPPSAFVQPGPLSGIGDLARRASYASGVTR